MKILCKKFFFACFSTLNWIFSFVLLSKFKSENEPGNRHGRYYGFVADLFMDLGDYSN